MSTVTLRENELQLNGKATTLLCASLFYFRIPRENWEERMDQLRMAGYNCIDVYIPWNFHELRPGEWHFEDEHDVSAFLALAARHGLYVIARPGPYICSEWDGGALPSWLYQPGAVLRQNDETYLKALSGWLEKVLPIVAERQFTHGGSVVAVQLENELDFYGCTDPAGYMTRLHEIARGSGIDVPLIACAGECDVQGCSGYVEDIYPAFNAYSDDYFAHLETQLHHMRELAAQRGGPLMITETNRVHAFLKRELLCGARLISPYNQVGGTDFDMTNGISNWASDIAKPLALMASDYDFVSMITVDGRLREEAAEARLMASMMNALGEKLSASKPCAAPTTLRCDFPCAQLLGEDGRDANLFPSVELGCGWLMGASNLGEKDGALRFDTEDGEASLTVHGHKTVILPWKLDLSSYGCKGASILWAEAEILSFRQTENGLEVSFVGGENARAMLSVGGEKHIVTGKVWTELNGLRVRILPRSEAVFECPSLPPLTEAIPSVVSAREIDHFRAQDVSVKGLAHPLADRLCSMENAGQYRGDVFYRFSVKGNDPVMLLSPADFLWISNGNGTKALYCDGSDLLLPAAEGEWQVRAQSWGHVNFDDVRQPSLHMGSGKGIEGAACIVEQQEITDLWYIFPYPKYRRQNRPDLRETDRILATTLNSWSYPSAPMDADFERRVYFRPDCDCFWLQLEYPDSQVTVFVNDQPVGVLQPGVSLLRLNLPEGLRGGATLRLHTVRRFSHTTLGRAHLLSGRRIAEGSMSGADVNVWRNIHPAEGGKAVRLPVSLAPGQEVLLSGILPEGENRARTLVLEGSGIEATLVAHGHVCGRVELKTEGYPEVRGGSSRRVYLPKGWSDDSVCLHLCGIGEGGALTAVRWEEIQR